MAAPHPDSYYAASARAAPHRAALAGSVECDICVVGGGIAGCSAALHLAERGYSVVLLEQHRIGWGASGRSGAQAIHAIIANASAGTANTSGARIRLRRHHGTPVGW